MKNETLLKRAEYNFQPFRHITIGDVCMFDDQTPFFISGFDKSNIHAFDENLRCCQYGNLILEEMHDENLGKDFVYVKILLSKAMNQMNLYRQYIEYERFVKSKTNIKCNSNQLLITVEKKDGNTSTELFDVESEKSCGIGTKYKQSFGMRADLKLDKDFDTFDNIVDKFSSLLGFDKEKDLILFEDNRDEIELE